MPSLREQPGGRDVSRDVPDAAPAGLPAGVASAKLASSNQVEASPRLDSSREPYTALLVRSVYVLAIGTLALIAGACAAPAAPSSPLLPGSGSARHGFEAAVPAGQPLVLPIAGPAGIPAAPVEPALFIPAIGDTREQNAVTAPTATARPLAPERKATAAPSPTVLAPRPTVSAPTPVPTVAAIATTSPSAPGTTTAGKAKSSPTAAAPSAAKQRQLAPDAETASRPQPSSRGQVRPAEPTPAPVSKEQRFIAAIAGPAQDSQRETGVPASITIAQAILESDWGKSRLAREGYNYFGIKAGNASGTAGTITLSTREVVDGATVVVNARFRAYDSMTDSFVDHGQYFLKNRRYATALAHRDHPQEFARQIQIAGYATDPGYATKLIRLMDRYRLYDFDLPGE